MCLWAVFSLCCFYLCFFNLYRNIPAIKLILMCGYSELADLFDPDLVKPEDLEEWCKKNLRGAV